MPGDAPPDLEPVFHTKIIAKGGDSSWFVYKRKAVFENVIPLDKEEGKLLLAWRIKGFGKNKYNPFSGPIESPFKVEDSIRQDLKTQAGLEASEITKVGKFIMVVENNPIALDINVYRATNYKGEPIKTNETRPEWFAISSSSTCAESLDRLPLQQMFADNQHWIHLVATEEQFIGRCDYGASEDKDDVGKLLRWWFATV